MSKLLLINNWSLKKLLATEEDSFSRAKLKILFTVVIFAIIKAMVACVFAYINHQSFQMTRAIVVMVCWAGLLKMLLSCNKLLNAFTHLMLWLGILVVWSTVFISAQGVNIVVMQFTYMGMLSSFYLLNRNMALLYSTLNVSPIIMAVCFPSLKLNMNIVAQQLGAPGTQIILALNFMSALTAHFLYHQAFSENLREKEQLNTKLESAVKTANEHARAKSDFLSVMSHELRTPLNAVIGITDILLDEPYDKQQDENLKILKFSAFSLQTIVNDILDFNKIDSNKIQLERVSVNLYDLVSNICSGLDIQAREKGLRLILDLDESLRRQYVITDPVRISQVIYNLVGNGIKFTSEGYVKVSLRVTSKSDKEATILFAVEDTGIGIPAEKHEIIFEPFTQASSNTTRNYGGTGLGLSIVKRLLSLFGSAIHLESTENTGSTFSFSINTLLDNTPAGTNGDQPESAKELANMRMLIAEDNPLNVHVIRKLCIKWDIEYDIAENGQEVLEKVRDNNYDVILMDIHMPLINGYDASREIRLMADQVKAHIPILALTASVSSDLAEKALAAGMNGALHKPFRHQELQSKLLSIKREQQSL